MISPNKYGFLHENAYVIKDETQNATLFTTGNGYYGIRGSFEEFGSQFVQGGFIRGLFDEVIEFPQTFIDNIYMKKYYFDEEKLKNFEYQDSGINFADILYTRIKVGKIEFFPWEGEILKWNRYLDTSSATLVREVLWNDGLGNITKIKFERFASFENDHIYCIRTTVKRMNHNLDITLSSGIDTRVKTVGQKKAKIKEYLIKNNLITLNVDIGNMYNFDVAVSSHTTYHNCEHDSIEYIASKGIYYSKIKANKNQKEIVLEKIIYTNTSRDYDDKRDVMNENINEISLVKSKKYEELFAEHKYSWNNFFRNIDIKITGDEMADSVLRFANYHSAISIARNDHVHSLSAKNLTGEKYNQFVWWDCEIYQLPIFIHTAPNVAKEVLLYRYKLLNQAKLIAVNDGFSGAKFPFVSSVTGDEKVWEYARHPFMQIHINSDIAYGVINYFINTLDNEFMKKYGMEMLIEISKYWISRSTLLEGKYQIINVTGTDEHHPYVNNNAYTNYLTQFVLSKTLEYIEFYKENKFDKVFNIDLIKLIDVCNNIYLPFDDSGVIPQFDGYLKLDKDLEIVGDGAGKGFQMKESGLYHKSQIIKQPDVMLLYSYINLDNKVPNYELNWKYYEEVCEKSSSLTYPVHAICAIDNNQLDSFYNYFMQSIRIDIDDLHKVAYQGIHAASMSGGWYSIFRGLFGIIPRVDYIEINPKIIPQFKKIDIKFYYQGVYIKMYIKGNKINILKSKTDKTVRIKYQSNNYLLEELLEIDINE